MAFWNHLRLTPDYQRLSQFAGNLATCLEAGVGTSVSLERTLRALAGTPMHEASEEIVQKVKHGDSLADALRAARGWPPFFVPMIEAGEQTGRVDESLRYLEHHCRLLAAPAKSLRDAWLLPLSIAIAGTMFKFLAHLFLAPFSATLAFVFNSATSYATFGLVAFVVLGPPAKPLFDRLKLQLPLVGDVERETSINRFFHAFAMLYAAAGQRVEQMIEVAAETVSNVAIRDDFRGIAERIREQRSIPEAFRPARIIGSEQFAAIENGDLSGTLEAACRRISETAADRLEVRLQLFQTFALRIMMAIVAFTVTITIWTLIEVF